MSTAEVIRSLSESSIVNVLEFFMIGFIVTATYMTIHTLKGHVKPATKVLLAMFFGTIAYSVGKAFVFLLVISPILNDSATKMRF